MIVNVIGTMAVPIEVRCVKCGAALVYSAYPTNDYKRARQIITVKVEPCRACTASLAKGLIDTAPYSIGNTIKNESV